jgi:hypothetical protein
MNFWNWNEGLPQKYDSIMEFVVDKQNPACNVSNFKTLARSQSSARSGILTNNGHLTGERWYQLAQKGGSKMIWGLNVTTNKPSGTLKFLQYLKGKNINPKRFELGNELYHGRYRCVTPTTEYYIKQAKKHLTSIRKVFPDAKVAVPIYANAARVAAKPVSVGLSSPISWNKVLSNNQGFYDAVVIHIYFFPFVKAELGSSPLPTKNEMVRWGAVRSSEATMKSLMEWVEKYWPNKEIWMTEWALNNKPAFRPKKYGSKYRVNHTVFDGLFTANVVLNTASFKSNITFANFWQIYGGFLGMVSSRGIKRPPYYVFKFLSAPVHTASKIEHIKIKGVPTVRGPRKFSGLTAPLLDAYAFFDSHGKVTYLVFVNKLSKDVTISYNKLGRDAQGMQRYITSSPSSELLPGWGDPSNPAKSVNWNPPFDVMKDTVNLNSFTLPKWSFSVVKIAGR